MMKQNKEEELLCKRLKELAYHSYHKGINIYTDFLNLNEINLFESIKRELPNIQYGFWGGYTDAERRVICFFNDDSFLHSAFPIVCIKIIPSNAKFSEELSHRDFLGAILNLGIERYTIGDILIKENEGYVFCNDRIAIYILDHLNKIKHTNIKSQIVSLEDIQITPKLKEMKGTVSSLRLDSVLSLALKSSRSSLVNLISTGNVFVNSKRIESNSYILEDGDVISVRGNGKFIFKDTLNMTKKGRYSITILKYV